MNFEISEESYSKATVKTSTILQDYVIMPAKTSLLCRARSHFTELLNGLLESPPPGVCFYEGQANDRKIKKFQHRFTMIIICMSFFSAMRSNWTTSAFRYLCFRPTFHRKLFPFLHVSSPCLRLADIKTLKNLSHSSSIYPVSGKVYAQHGF